MAPETVRANQIPNTTGALEPISAKDIISGRDGSFPMDEAVIEGSEDF